MRRLGSILLGTYGYVVFLAVALALFPVFVVVAAWKRDSDPGYRARGRVMRALGRWSAKITGVWHFSVAGTPPPDIARRAYVVVSNHESMADMFLLSYLPFDMRWLGKEEMWRLPFIGWLLRCSGDVKVRRGEGDSIRAAMVELRSTIAAGMSVMIFPEGTRSRDGKPLRYKDGAFQLAIEMGAPVLPVRLTGTRGCIPAKSAWFAEAWASATLLEPIETEGLTLDDVPALRDKVRALITQTTEPERRAA
jgi:1-acyl-sn-glycerol-3-phosphate acyltransferase